MKSLKSILFTLVLSLAVLAGCTSADTEAPGSAMTEEERIDAMIKLIEAEEAKMEASESVETEETAETEEEVVEEEAVEADTEEVATEEATEASEDSMTE
ncbi:MAG: hypothetical protein OEY44_01725 [Candidatus Peregrinibacteria bacterium]|nr:hypothetical protein [Candidatus Peregrinibacteria bacterium]